MRTNRQVSARQIPRFAGIAHALRTLDPIWSELFPAEQRRIVQLLVEEVTLYPGSFDIRYRTDGLHTLMAELSDTDTRSVA